MADKKRKVSGLNTTVQAPKKVKKSRKASSEDAQAVASEEPAKPAALTNDSTPAPVKKPRKRAADFLEDEPEPTPPKKGKKATAAPGPEPASLTVDGANGAAGNSDVEETAMTTTKRPKQKSMMAEAERTQEQELEDEWGPADEGSGDEEIDSAPALLAGFDSDNDDPAEDKDFDASRVAPIPQFKKTSKKLRQAKQKKADGPGVVYVGRIPHGFYESQMREYFSQFGDITRLRLSRNKKTGASKHFAFIEFASDEVAKIVADTMDNYLMFGHILKCKYAPEGSLHEDVWKGANRKFRRIPHHKLLRQQAEQPKTLEQMEKKMNKEQQRRLKKQEKMKELGYEYSLPELKKPEANDMPAVENALLLEDGVEGSLIPPADVPKDVLAAKVEDEMKSSKSTKRSKRADKDVPSVEQAKSGAASKKVAKKLEKEAQETADAAAPSAEQMTKAKKQKVKAEAPSASRAPKRDDKQLKGILKKPKKA